MADGSLFGRTRGPIFTDVFCGGGGASLGMSRMNPSPPRRAAPSRGARRGFSPHFEDLK